MRLGFIVTTGLAALALATPGLAAPAAGGHGSGHASGQGSKHGGVAAAIADRARPAEDTARDGARKPAEMLAFAGVRPGMKIADLLPGNGYFTRLFAKAVGPRGVVYGWLPDGIPERYVEPFNPVVKAYPNVKLVRGDVLRVPVKLDLVWTSQNYHDLYLRGGSPDATNAAVFAALKPGGTYLVIDHRGAAGTGTSETGTLHRIDEAAVIAGVLKAGFEFDGEDMSLRRADDDHSQPVFKRHDATDQMALRFRKPARAK